MSEFAVVRTTNFSDECEITLYDTYDEAKDGLQNLWQDYYNEEIAENGNALSEDECFHEDEYAQVKWLDKDVSQSRLTGEICYK